MLEAVLFMTWFFLPAGAANMAPVIARRWSFLNAFNRPIDGGRTYRGQRVLGDNKTWRGLMAGWILALAVATVQALFLDGFNLSLSFLLWYSFLLSMGALLGDAVESFFKRQAGIAPGRSWVPFDQLDWIVGAMAASLLIVRLPLWYYALGLALGLILHPLVNILGWLLKLKDKPF